MCCCRYVLLVTVAAEPTRTLALTDSLSLSCVCGGWQATVPLARPGTPYRSLARSLV